MRPHPAKCPAHHPPVFAQAPLAHMAHTVGMPVAPRPRARQPGRQRIGQARVEIELGPVAHDQVAAPAHREPLRCRAAHALLQHPAQRPARPQILRQAQCFALVHSAGVEAVARLELAAVEAHVLPGLEQIPLHLQLQHLAAAE
jgi:hypothetical protein